MYVHLIIYNVRALSCNGVIFTVTVSSIHYTLCSKQCTTIAFEAQPVSSAVYLVSQQDCLTSCIFISHAFFPTQAAKQKAFTNVAKAEFN